MEMALPWGRWMSGGGEDWGEGNLRGGEEGQVWRVREGDGRVMEMRCEGRLGGR